MNKAKAIREYTAQHPELSVHALWLAMQKDGIDVTENNIRVTISRWNKQGRGIVRSRGKPRTEHSLKELTEMFVRGCGGYDNAKKMLESFGC